jgi:hypothetical protein
MEQETFVEQLAGENQSTQKNTWFDIGYLKI